MKKEKVKEIVNLKAIVACTVLFIFMLLLNGLTPYVADDFSYMNSFKDGRRITSVFQIFPSLAEHYMVSIGRIVPHFFAQLFLMGPKWIFNLVNAAMFTAIVYLVLKMSNYAKNFSILMFALVFVLLWLYVPAFGQVFLWETGSFNYVWSFFFGILFLIPYVKLYLYDICMKPMWKKVLFCGYTFLFGAYSESVSFSVIFIGFLMLMEVMLRKKQIRAYLFYVIPVICGAAGYLTILASPGEATHVAGHGIGGAVKLLVEIYEAFYVKERGLLILWAVLMVLAVYRKRQRERIMLSVYLMLINICAVTLLCFGSYLEQRSLAAGAFFLICSIVNLLEDLREDAYGRKWGALSYVIAAYFIVNSLLCIWTGVYDIYDTNRRNAMREQQIISQAASGATVVTVPRVESETIYSAKNQLADLMTAEQDATWPNKAIAKYYGLEMIYGE